MQVGFQFDLQSARNVWFERERKSRRTQSRNQSKLFVIRTKIRLSMIGSQIPTIEIVQKTVEVVPQVQFLIEWWMCQLLMVCASQCPNTAIQRCTTGSSILYHDFGHMCFGRRNQISGHYDFGNFNNVGASSILTWVLADTASAVCPAHLGSLEIMSMTFAAVICVADEPCSVNTANDFESFFTMSPRRTTLPLYF